MFYHKVIGVTTFYLFVEGHAASPNVSRVLESIPNYDHLPKETHFGLYREATRGNPNYFLTYGNEKEAPRVQDELCPNGAH
ncbi:hypothetical protein ES319_A13G227900v1 [Gossypium barbadense]|uniref:Uncharacterized protein n=1 Tax=Gossypium barbadense TaxID=3634 RepID=A0A5J5T2M7_GOSBA|nr:hypothetical protein ES319_A13G227900v1 [Gossypium barbadense]KAB2050183.1 hypothetical protein ES319_A13G227900v1 [Gossypium barbadense]